jgi:hypothetical protein
LSPRELAVRFTDEKKYFVSEASVYRLPKAYDLITSPAYVVIKAANEFKDKTTAINQLWQTDFTYHLALAASGLDRATVVHRPRLLSDNAHLTRLAIWPSGLRVRVWSMCVGRRITLKPKARSSVGTRP